MGPEGGGCEGLWRGTGEETEKQNLGVRTSDFTVVMRGLGEQESQGGKSRTGPANQGTTAERQHQASFILTLSKKKHQQKTSMFIAPGQGMDNLPLSCRSRDILQTLVPTHEVFRYEGAWLLPQEVSVSLTCVHS